MLPAIRVEFDQYSVKISPVVQSGKYPDDFECYQRAELIPDEELACPPEARATLTADSDQPAAETAGYLSAAMSAVAALLQDGAEKDDLRIAEVWIPAFRHHSVFLYTTAVARSWRCCTTARQTAICASRR